MTSAPKSVALKFQRDTSLFKLLSLARLLSLAILALLVTSVGAFADLVTITDFTRTSNIQSHGGWGWDPAPNKALLIQSPHAGSYLEESSIFRDVGGKSLLSLTASWDPILSNDGVFRLLLTGTGGVDIAYADFSLSQFSGGSYVTRDAPLNFFNNGSGTNVDVLFLLPQSGFSSNTAGVLYLREMRASSVTEPSSIALLCVVAAAGAYRRRRWCRN